MALIIGLTGSIGTGKSLIANKLKELHIPVVDADIIAREVVEPGKEAYKKIVETFGEKILYENGTINRKALGKIVFNDEKERKKLNDITHPAIREEMLRQRDEYIQQGHECVVLDIPLLYESNLTHFVDKVIVVYVDHDVQLERIMKRDNSTKEEALARIKSQLPVSEKVKKADAVINNNGTKEESYNQLIDILTKWGIKL